MLNFLAWAVNSYSAGVFNLILSEQSGVYLCWVWAVTLLVFWLHSVLCLIPWKLSGIFPVCLGRCGAGYWAMDWKWPHVSSAMLHTPDQSWKTYSKMFLSNLIGVFAHDEVRPKQNVKINLNAFAIKSFNRNTVDQTVHGEKFVKCTFLNDILLDCRFYSIHVAFLFLLKHRLQEVHKILRHKPLS